MPFENPWVQFCKSLVLLRANVDGASTEGQGMQTWPPAPVHRWPVDCSDDGESVGIRAQSVMPFTRLQNSCIAKIKGHLEDGVHRGAGGRGGHKHHGGRGAMRPRYIYTTISPMLRVQNEAQSANILL